LITILAEETANKPGQSGRRNNLRNSSGESCRHQPSHSWRTAIRLQSHCRKFQMLLCKPCTSARRTMFYFYGHFKLILSNALENQAAASH